MDRLLDAILAPALVPAAWLLKKVRNRGLQRLPRSRRMLERVGVLPVVDHFYEPLSNPRDLRHDLATPRNLPGIDLDVDTQLQFVRELSYSSELAAVPRTQQGSHPHYWFANPHFTYRDGVFWYNVVRALKPRRIIEIGSGFSTLLAAMALKKNREDDASYSCSHTCVEPYQRTWLEEAGIHVIRKIVQEVDPAMFDQLEAGDILFIDSSHVIRPQGDVVQEYLEIVPRVNPGVVVHAHDIFTPRDYPAEWVLRRKRLWNEQYLLEALLTGNAQFEVLASLNHLYHDRADAMKVVWPAPDENEPSSFYFRRRA